MQNFLSQQENIDFTTKYSKIPEELLNIQWLVDTNLHRDLRSTNRDTGRKLQTLQKN